MKRMRNAWFILLGMLWALSPTDLVRAQTTAPATAPATQPVAAERRIPPAGSRAAIVHLEGEINDFSRTMLLRRVEEARSLGVDAVVVRINTWGGAVTSALEISQFLKRQNDLRTIAYVQEKAISAGALIALACDELVMEPGSSIGDCAPILAGPQGLQPLPAAERAKFESPILNDFFDSATRNGHDPLLVQAMVSVGRVVHYVVDDAGDTRFVDAAEYERLRGEGWRPVEGVPNPLDGPEELLTLNASLAERLRLSAGTYPTAEEFVQSRRMDLVATLAPAGGERMIGMLSGTAVRGVLSIVFMLALYSAFRSPGTGIPEALCVVSLALLVGVPALTGYAQWWEVLAVLLGVILLAVEIFVTPGFGVAGISGIVLVAAGLTMTFVPLEPPEYPGVLPSLPATQEAIRRGLLVTVGGMAASLALWFWLQRYLPRLPVLNRLVLTSTVDGGATLDANAAPRPSGQEFPPVGARGRAVTDLRPGGTAAFDDPASGDRRHVDVVGESGYVAAGTPIVVREVHGNRIVVRATREA